MPQEPRDFAQWTKSVERRLQQALRAGQSPQAVRLARDLQRVRDEVKDIEVGSAPQPAAPVELVTETRVLPDLTGAPRGEVSVSFAPVTVDVNANPIEVDRYELWLEAVEPEAEEEEEPGDGDFGWEEDDSWRTNLVTDTESEYWRSRNTPRTKQVADLQEGEDFVAGDRIRFSVTVDTFGVNPRPGDFERLMHSVRMSAFNAQSVEDAVWQMTILPTSNEGDSSDRTVETYTLEAEVPEGTTRITAHYAGTIRAGHIEFINPVLFNLSETKPEPPETQASKMVSTSLEPRLSYSPLDVDGEYEVKVRAIAGTRAGPMSATRRVKIEADRTPPPIPSALELSSSGATVMASWDLLAGTGDPMPSDFSHTEVAYGYLPPPTEIAGSITLLFSQYIFETPQQPSDVDFDGTWYFRHRAVDTSGNKSPWSATSSIVPKSLVDTAALQFELDEKQRQIDEAKQLMDTGLTEVNDKLIPLEELSEQNQSRLDTLNNETLPGLQSELESGLEGVNQNLIPLEQLADANQSRLDTLDNTTLPALKGDLTALQGELDGIDLTGINSRLGEAESELDTLNSTTLPGLNNTITQGLADLDWREVGAISASNIRIGSYENLLPEDYIWELREKGLDGTPIWDATTGGAAGWTTIPNQLGMPVLIRFNASQHNGAFSRLAFMGPSGKGIRVHPGEEFSLTGTGWVSSGASDELLLNIRYATEDGSYITRIGAGQFPNGSFSHTWEVPNDSTIQRMQIEFTATSAASGNAHMGDIRLRARITSNLIVDGAVIADKIATNAVESDKITANAITAAKIASNAVTADKINANAVTAGKIAANAVRANEIAANTIVAGNIATDAIQTRHLQANSVGANQIIANSIGTDHLQARSIQAHQLQVGSFDNLFSDQQFTSYRDFGEGTNSPWSRVTGNPENVWQWEDEPNVGASIVSVTSGVASRMEVYCGEVSPGDRMSFRIRVRKTNGADGFRINARHRGEDRSSPLSTTVLLGNSFSNLPSDSVWEFNWTVPSNSGIRELWVDFETQSTSTGVARFSDPYMRRRIESQLLVDGAVIAGKIATNAIETRHLQTNSVGADQIIANSIGADHVQSKTLQTHHLQVGNFDNLWDDPYAEDFLSEGGDSPYWSFGGNGAGNWITIRNQGGLRRLLRASADITSNSEIRYHPTGHEWGLEVQPGEEYLLEFYGWRSSVGRVRVRARYNPESGGTASGTVSPENHILSAGWRSPALSFVVPDGMERMRIIFIREAGSGNCHYGQFRLRKRADSQLLVDGAVTARTIAAEAVTAEHITASSSLTSKVANFLTVQSNMIASNAVTADKISFGSLNGALITGLQIQTHTNNRGVKITSAGIRAFNSSGTETFTVNASNGDVSASGGTFTAARIHGGEITANVSVSSAIQVGDRYTGGSTSGGVLIRNSGTHGNILAYDSDGNVSARIGGGRHLFAGAVQADSVALKGEIRVGVGSDGEGGLTPVGDRLDIRGRVPELDNMSGETTFMAMTTPYSRARDWYANFDSGQLKLVRITYPHSAPRGARLPLAIMNINGSNSPGRGASASITRNRTNSYFNLAMGYSDSITTGANPRFAVTILSTWGQTTPGGFIDT